jgi:UDPglucose--hexose-1-phosphate uridylyltransferase
VVRRTRSTLADGREIVWYDAEGAPERTAVDERDLDPRGAAPEMRHDALRQEWVSVAAHRSGRTFLPAADDCPLCPSRDGRLTEVPGEDYQVVVFENRFPSFAGPPGPVAEAEGLFAARPAAGRCEVVCFTSDHDTTFASLDVDRARLVVDVWADRTAELSRTPGVEHVFVFENCGEAIGVTLGHPHGQVYGYPFVPPVAREQWAAARGYGRSTGGNLFADLVATELDDGARMVLESEHWVAFVPFAARWPVEVQLHPRRRVADLTELDEAQRDDLAPAYLDLLRRCDALYGMRLPYIAAWHQASVRAARDLLPLHLELFSVQRAPDRLKFLAGSESAMGAFINDRTPEDVAARLREVAAP